MKTNTKVLRCTIMLLFVYAGSAISENTRIYLAAEDGNGNPKEVNDNYFDCNRKIYAVIELDGMPNTKRRIEASKHTIEALWEDPHGKLREQTETTFFITQTKKVVWVWLRLHRLVEAVLERVLLLDRAYGMEDFIGEWTVVLYLDGKFLQERTFTVYC